jgi:DNA-binding Xre family transcriptional regulator
MTRSETNIDVVLAKNGIRKDKDLAKLMDISPASLSARLSNNISTKTLEDISKALNVPLIDLIKATE